MSRYDTILFDMGYTLVNFEPLQEIIAQEALRAAGAERSVDDIQAAVQVVWGDYYRDAATVTFPATPEYDRQAESALARGLLAHLGVEGGEKALRAYVDSIESWFSRPGVVRPYSEVVEVLDALVARGYRLGIVSNWSWNLRDRVAQVGLEGYFELVWASAYAGCNKPHPGIFYQALAQMDVPPDRALYVGDSYRHDVVGARNAGLDVVLLARDYRHDVVGARNAGLDVVLLARDGTADAPDCPVIADLWGLLGYLEE